MRTSIVILTACLALCHSYHLRQEARLNDQLQLIRDQMQTQTPTTPVNPPALPYPVDRMPAVVHWIDDFGNATVSIGEDPRLSCARR